MPQFHLIILPVHVKLQETHLLIYLITFAANLIYFFGCHAIAVSSVLMINI